MPITNSDISNLRYFWEEKHDIERWSGYTKEKEAELFLAFPSLAAAIIRYREAKECITLLLRAIDGTIKEDN